MKKETIAAIFFGILLGVGGAVIMVGKAKQIGTNKVSVGSAKNITPEVSRNAKIQPLQITQPKTQSKFATNSLTIKGKASKEGLIVIQSPIKELVFKNIKESFSVEFPLALGENVITVTVYPKESQIPAQTKTLKLYFLDEQ